MNASATPKRRKELVEKEKAVAKPRAKAAKKAKDLAAEYKKYFTAPQTTPDAFRIFDITDGSGITYSSHT